MTKVFPFDSVPRSPHPPSGIKMRFGPPFGPFLVLAGDPRGCWYVQYTLFDVVWQDRMAVFCVLPGTEDRDMNRLRGLEGQFHLVKCQGWEEIDPDVKQKLLDMKPIRIDGDPRFDRRLKNWHHIELDPLRNGRLK